MDIDGFQDGYLHKEAIAPAVAASLGAGGKMIGGAAVAGPIIGGAAGMAGKSADKLKAIALLLPIMLGVGAGASVSKLTSPSGTDTENMQKSLLASEMEEAITELRRKKAFANEDDNTGEAPREIRF